MIDTREGPGIPRRSRFSSWECGHDDDHAGCKGASGALDALWCGCPCHYMDDAPERHPSALLSAGRPADSPIVIEARAG